MKTLTMNILKELVDYIKSNLRLDIRNDLSGNEHICLLFGDEVLSTTKLPGNDTTEFNGI